MTVLIYLLHTLLDRSCEACRRRRRVGGMARLLWERVRCVCTTLCSPAGPSDRSSDARWAHSVVRRRVLWPVRLRASWACRVTGAAVAATVTITVTPHAARGHTDGRVHKRTPGSANRGHAEQRWVHRAVGPHE